MKREFLATLGALMLIAAFQPRSTASPLILSKDAGGHVLPNALSLELRSNPDCDQTQLLIPDGSNLVSNDFIMQVDENGIGFFAGAAKIVTPDGRTILGGMLRGTIGLTAHSTVTDKPCQAPGHFEGMLNGPPPPTGTEPGPAVIPEPFEVNVSLDVIPQAAGIVPLYKGNLTGLIPPAPPLPPALVFITPSKALYATNEPVVAIIANKSERDIQIFDEQSYGTIVQMQHLVGQDWVMVGVWQYFAPPIPVVINAGTEIKVLLPSDASSTNRHEPGTYRLVIDYQTLGADGKPLDGLQKVISPLFKIADLPPPAAHLAVKPDKPGYTSTEAITAIIANGAMTVGILDGESLCTIVQLQRAEGIGWVPEGPCPLDRMPIPTILKPGEMKSVVLAKDTPWVTGKYRLAVTYTALDAAGKPAGPSQTAVSEPFPVGSPPPPQLVALTPDMRSYTLTQPIVATFANKGRVDVVTWDHRSFCTVIDLQINDPSGWRTIAPCMLKSPTMPVVIMAGESLMVPLPPEAGFAPKWEPGVYRLHAAYAPATPAGSPGDVLMEVVSEPFAVGLPPPPPTPMVVLAPDKRSYTVTQPIIATITNRSNTDVMTWDHRSFCGAINLQVKAATGWQTVYPCMILTVPQPVLIKAGASLVVPLPPDTTTPPRWEAGVYRLQLLYGVPNSAGEVSDVQSEAVSEPFLVGVATTGIVLQVPEMTTFTLPWRLRISGE